jgi:adenosyl cobinamide kinase/adenosyl cobinamide phosphate guanylyltransferase
MLERVARHRARRPDAWTTIEVVGSPAPHVARAEGVVLIDAITSWVAGAPDFAPDVDELLRALRFTKADVVIVTDEVGFGVSPSTVVGNEFRDVLGAVNGKISAVADEVFLAIAGRVVQLDRWSS